MKATIVIEQRIIENKPISALELAGDLIGFLEVGGDLSLKKHELIRGN